MADLADITQATEESLAEAMSRIPKPPAKHYTACVDCGDSLGENKPNYQRCEACAELWVSAVFKAEQRLKAQTSFDTIRLAGGRYGIK